MQIGWINSDMNSSQSNEEFSWSCGRSDPGRYFDIILKLEIRIKTSRGPNFVYFYTSSDDSACLSNHFETIDCGLLDCRPDCPRITKYSSVSPWRGTSHFKRKSTI
jgi:hypothetical protein